MDSLFSPYEVERANNLRLIVQSFGCKYICLWCYHRANFLVYMDGLYQEENSQASSSLGSIARRLFDDYGRETFFPANDRVPGLAFNNNRPYVELNELNLRAMSFNDLQRRFYQEARIKTAVFMGCSKGEIELGWSNETQIDMENKMKNWFPEDFSRQSPLTEIYQAVDPSSRPSSSSSSLRSLSMDSPESSSLLFNIASTSHIPVEAFLEAPALQSIPSSTDALQQAIQSLHPTPTTASPLQAILQSLQTFIPNTTNPPIQPLPTISTTSPHQQAMQAFAITRNIQLPTQESEDAAMTRAILTVLTSSPTTSSSSTPNFPYTTSPVTRRASAFKKYPSPLGPSVPTRANSRKLSMLKRAITYYRSLNIVRREHMVINRPTTTQLHHMISERKRREKINDSFQALRSLLPPDAKKDKASVLTRTRELLASLSAQVTELTKRNQQLEAQLLPKAKEAAVEPSESITERLNIQVIHVSDSASGQQVVDLQVTVRGDCPVLDMVIRILEFLKQDKNVNLTSMDARTHAAEPASFNRVTLRLNIEGEGWDEATFQEAVRRIVADLAH